MINIDKENCSINGTAPDILSEFTLLTNKLYKILGNHIKPESAKKMILEAVNLGIMSEKELMEELKKTLMEE